MDTLTKLIKNEDDKERTGEVVSSEGNSCKVQCGRYVFTARSTAGQVPTGATVTIKQTLIGEWLLIDVRGVVSRRKRKVEING